MSAFFGRMDEEEFEATYGFPKPNEKDDVVIYCRSGKRAATACNVMLLCNYEK